VFGFHVPGLLGIIPWYFEIFVEPVDGNHWLPFRLEFKPKSPRSLITPRMSSFNRFSILQDEERAPESNPTVATNECSYINTPEEPTQESSTPLSPLFTTCISLFRQLVYQFHNDTFIRLIPPSLTVQTSDEYSRLKIWGQQTRISDSRTRLALEDNLREEPQLRKTVSDALKQLTEEIRLGIAFHWGHPQIGRAYKTRDSNRHTSKPAARRLEPITWHRFG